MLVIRRREGEGLLIGNDIEIEILETTHGRVKIGIKAPPAYSITRREVARAAAENVTASRNLAPHDIACLSRMLACHEPEEDPAAVK